MSATSTQSNVPASVANIATGSYIDTGTAAAFTITTGFRPRWVRVINTAATGGSLEWFEGMTDAYAIKRVTAGDQTLITTLGITDNANGFTVGLDTDINVTSEQIRWIAIG
jgi:hypothetical protein